MKFLEKREAVSFKFLPPGWKAESHFGWNLTEMDRKGKNITWALFLIVYNWLLWDISEMTCQFPFEKEYEIYHGNKSSVVINIRKSVVGYLFGGWCGREQGLVTLPEILT